MNVDFMVGYWFGVVATCMGMWVSYKIGWFKKQGDENEEE